MELLEELNKFIRLEIDREDLEEAIGVELSHLSMDGNEPVANCEDLVKVIRAWLDGKIDKARLLEWVNTIWFSGCFNYPDDDKEDELESMASVMTLLEAWDEPEVDYSTEDLERMIEALANHRGLYWSDDGSGLTNDL